MDLMEYREYLRRIDDAESVRELHRIATEAQLAHPRDRDSAAIERACFARAESLIALGRRRPAASPDEARPAEPVDWRARAAQMGEE